MSQATRNLLDLAAQAFGGERTLCKCCGGMAPLFGQVDFNKSCEESKGITLPPSRILVSYFRCKGCGFLFTRFFDHWTQEEFQAHIYNEGYAKVDPEYLTVRPDSWIDGISALFGSYFSRISLLDWGGGAGRLAEGLRAKGIHRADTWEPFNPAFQATPEGAFNLLTCIEVLEHLPDPRVGIQNLVHFLPGEGAMILSTMLQPDDIEEIGTRWWYLAPRNGHISLFSRKALEFMLGKQGYHLLVVQPHIHFAWRTVPFYMEKTVNGPPS